MFYFTNICDHCRETRIETQPRRICPRCKERVIYSPANLKSCPLCHSEDIDITVDPETNEATLMCKNCTCSITQPSLAYAFIVWNTRNDETAGITVPENIVKIAFDSPTQAHTWVSIYRIADVVNGKFA